MKADKRRDYVPALGYHWLTPFYDFVVAATTRERRFKHALIEQAGVEPGHKVLDLACGTGTLAIGIKQREPKADVIGIDGDPRILSIAGRKARDANLPIRLECALAGSLPHPTATFDRAVSSLFFHHLSWEGKLDAAAELFRTLKAGGELHLADWGRPTNLLMRALYLPVQILDGYRNTQDNASGKLVELFDRAGFVNVEVRQTFDTMLGTVALYSATRP